MTDRLRSFNRLQIQRLSLLQLATFNRCRSIESRCSLKNVQCVPLATAFGFNQTEIWNLLGYKDSHLQANHEYEMYMTCLNFKQNIFCVLLQKKLFSYQLENFPLRGVELDEICSRTNVLGTLSIIWYTIFTEFDYFLFNFCLVN